MSKPTLHDRIGELVELAGVYFEDGAPRTAAVKLRQAADFLEQEANRRDRVYQEKQISRTALLSAKGVMGQ